ncbi:MAG: hypothetical protein HC845_13390 [Akkermansiaceae bacterium]|nr:hypothetical protein [Akkermansiaceae bacterium]
MKRIALIFSLLSASVLHSFGEVKVDEEAFGKSLGGWAKRDKATAEYPISGATYRTYKPEISTTPEGGIFVSVRIDHVRGWLSSDDHAVLEITVNPQGKISSAQSNIAIQGKSITSDVILSGNEAGKALLAPEAAVQVGTDLIANLSEKITPRKNRRSRARFLPRSSPPQLQQTLPSHPRRSRAHTRAAVEQADRFRTAQSA